MYKSVCWGIDEKRIYNLLIPEKLRKVTEKKADKKLQINWKKKLESQAVY